MAEALLPTCQVWADGRRLADGCTPGEDPTEPFVMTDLEVTWGRSNSIDQPEPGTCTFYVLDSGQSAQRFTDTLRIGSKIQIRASATVYPDPSISVLTWDPESYPDGAVVPYASGSADVRATTAVAGSTGTRSLRMEPKPYVTGAFSATFPPAPFSADPSAWDTVPQALAGQTWRFGASIRKPSALGGLQRVIIRPTYFDTPELSVGRIDYSRQVVVDYWDTGWTAASGVFVPPEGVWMGLSIEVVPGAQRWDTVGTDVTWDSVASSIQWDHVGRLYLDDLLLLAPPAGAGRSATVFSGRVTDMRASYDLKAGGTVIQVTAQTDLAELANRYVGATPWPMEGVLPRFKHIVDESGQYVEYAVDSSVANIPITWRDVDSQPAATLLSQLAQSVGGALWHAATNNGDTFLWLEDINNRPPLNHIQRDADGVIRIHPNETTDIGERTITVDACDLNLEPTEWVQTTEDDATRVVVTWQEQTLDNDGQQRPVSHDYWVDDLAQEMLTGRRRVQVTTQLAALGDAQLLADALLARLSSPGWRVNGLTWDMYAQDQVDADVLDRVMRVLDGVTRLGLGMLVQGIPSWAPAGDGDIWLFLEGGRYTNIDGRWKLELNTSAGNAQGASTVKWDDLPSNNAMRTNKAPNPRAENIGTSWTAVRGFGTGGAGAYSYDTVSTPPLVGLATVRRKTWTTGSTSTADSGFQIQWSSTQLIPVTPGQQLTVSIYVRHTSATAKSARWIVQFYNQVNIAGSTLVSDIRQAATPITSEWSRLTFTVTVPTGAGGVMLYPDIVASTGQWAAGHVLEMTGLLVEYSGGSGGG